MSNRTYDDIWKEAISHLRTIQTDIELEQRSAKQPNDRKFGDAKTSNTNEESLLFRECAISYIHYIRIFERLERCHDAIIQPQKRGEVKMTLEFVISRVIELKHRLVKLSSPRAVVAVENGSLLSNEKHETDNVLGRHRRYGDLNDVLKDLKIPPNAFNVPIPRFYKEDNEIQRNRRDALVQGYMKMKLGVDNLPIDERSEIIGIEPRTVDDESDQIDNLPVSNPKSDVSPSKSRGGKPIKKKTDRRAVEPDAAALKIQKVFRGVTSRKQAQIEHRKEEVLLGMRNGSRSRIKTLESDVENAYKIRKQQQTKNREDFEKALVDLKDVVMEEEGYEIQEKLREDRTRWITEQIAETNTIPESLQGFYDKDNKPPVEMVEPANVESNDKKKGSAATGKAPAKGTKKEPTDNQTDVLPPPAGSFAKSGITDELKLKIKDYELVWQNRDEFDRLSQKHDPELAKDLIVRDRVRNELTKHVDEMLVMNLNKIKALHYSESKHSKTKKGGKKKKGGGGKKKKKKGKAKGKKGKLLPGAKLSDLKNADSGYMLSVLVEHKIINNFKNVKIEDFRGTNDSSRPFTASKSHPFDTVRNPTMAELRALITEYCILPQGSATIKRKINDDDNVRSIMLYGPSGSGKTLMVEAIAAELGALLINLSPHRLQGKFTEKNGPTKLIHMAFSIAKDPSFAPVVIYVDECEEFFQRNKKKKKGTPPVDKNGPNRFQKDLLIYKNQGLTKEDRVIVIGTTKHPEKADLKLLKWKGPTGKPIKQGFFERILFVPYPNYYDRVLLWKHFVRDRIERRVGAIAVNRDGISIVPGTIDFSSLAKMTEGYSPKTIEDCVANVFSSDRVRGFVSRPLAEIEFLASLSLPSERSYEEDNDRFFEFASRVLEIDSQTKSSKDANKKNGSAKKNGKKKK